jgi:hypothetical protein
MQAWKYRLATCALAAALAAVAACNSAQDPEELAASEFRQRLAQNKVDLIYAGSSDFLRGKTTESEFRKSVYKAQALGVIEDTRRAHFTRTQIPGEPDLVVAFYNSRFTKGSCLESFSWRVEPNGLKLETYSCAPNMQVTCTGAVADSKCETSRLPQPGFASAP